jgi:hypothetical protein
MPFDKDKDKTKKLRDQLTSGIIGNQLIEFSPHLSEAVTIKKMDNIYGRLKPIEMKNMIDSSILVSSQMQQDLLSLCKLDNPRFHLLYRATRDDFSSANFHS